MTNKYCCVFKLRSQHPIVNSKYLAVATHTTFNRMRFFASFAFFFLLLSGPAAVPSTSVLYSSPSAPSSNSFSPGPLPLSTNVPTSGVVIIVSSSIALMSIIGITTALVLRKKQRFHFQGTTAMGYRYHVNDTGETVVSFTT